METQRKANPLANASVMRLMLQFSIPSIIAMLVGALYNIVDQLFIGQAVGTLGNAATNVAFPLSTVCLAISLLLGIGGAACYNLSMGRGQKEKAPYFIGNTLTVLILSGLGLLVATLLFLTPLLRLFGSPDNVLPYAEIYVQITAIGFPFMILTTGGGHLIRADGSPMMTMVCNLSGAVINTGLDALFVFGFGMGMAGAAWATVIGQVFSAGIVLVYFLWFKKTDLNFHHLIPKLRPIARICSIGLSSCLNQLAMMVVQIILNLSLVYYGSLSVFGDAIPLAVAGIVTKVNMIFFSICIGLGQGAQPIESFNYGAKQYGRVRKAYWYSSIAGILISLAAFVLFQIIPRPLIALFGDGTEEYFEFGVMYFRVFLFFTWLNSVQPITSTFFTSIGKPLKGVFLSLTRQILFLVPLLLILPLFWGIDGILYAGPAADLIAAVVTVGIALLEFRFMHREEKRMAESP